MTAKPTKAQRALLESLIRDDGAIICDERFGNAWIAGGGDVHQQVFGALIRKGWLVGGDEPRRYMRYRISDSGRAVVS